MRSLLSDPEKFITNFCSKTTTRNLAGIDPDDLRQVLLKIHQLVDFNSVNTLDKWTPEGSPQTVISIGWMTGGGDGKIKMKSPRFGICTDARAEATSGATRLYLWVDHRALDELPDNVRPFPRKGSPFDWRSGENGKPDPTQKFYRISDPLYSTAEGHKALAEIRIKGGTHVVGLPDLLRGLGRLIKQPTTNAVQSVAPYAKGLGLEPGCYTPAAIGAFNATIRRA